MKFLFAFFVIISLLLIGCQSQDAAPSPSLNEDKRMNPEIGDAEPFDPEEETPSLDSGQDDGPTVVVVGQDIRKTDVPEDMVEEQDPVMHEPGITIMEISAHDGMGDCWVVWDNVVYDITDYLPRHGGGPGAIAPFCGTSDDFSRAFTNQHGTSKIRKLMDEGMRVGEFR